MMLAQSEFQDHLKFHLKFDYASNAVFYLGEIAFVQGKYPEALDHYSDVIANFPSSFKLGAARYKRGVTYIAMGKRPEGVADLRAVTRLFPKTDEDQAARSKLKELGASACSGAGITKSDSRSTDTFRLGAPTSVAAPGTCPDEFNREVARCLSPRPPPFLRFPLR